MRSAAVLLLKPRCTVRASAPLAARVARRALRSMRPPPRAVAGRAALLVRRARGMSRRYMQRRPQPELDVREFVPQRLH